MPASIPELHSLGTLGGNLREAHAANFENHNLIANYWGTHLHHQSHFLGRFWNLVYLFLDCVCSIPCDRQRKLMQAIDKTNRLFQENLKHIKTYYTLYEHNLNQTAQGIELSKQDLGKLRSGITDWNRTTHLLSQVNQPIKFAIGHLNEPYLEELRLMQTFISIEAKYPQPIPIAALSKLGGGDSLTDTENKQVEDWITFLNDRPNLLTSGQLRQLLKGIVALHTSYIPVAQLEAKLDNRGLKLVKQPDPQDELWKKSLSPGTKITIGQQEWTLGDPINPKEDEDHRKIYAIDGDSDKVIVVGAFPADLGIQQKMHGNERVAKISALDATERIGIMERLLPWEDLQLTPDDISMIATFIKEQVTQNKNHSHLKTRSWMLTPDRSKLLCTKIQKQKATLNPLELRDFALHVTQGNQDLYRQLIADSGLTDLQIDNYYIDLIQEAFNESPEKRMVNFKYKQINKFVKASASSFIQHVQEIHQEIIDSLTIDSAEVNFRQIVIDQMIETYRDSQGLGYFFPDFNMNVITWIKTRLN